jgi:hypothetical protein
MRQDGQSMLDMADVGFNARARTENHDFAVNRRASPPEKRKTTRGFR